MNDKDQLLPCPTCPWRVGKDARSIPRYDQEQAENLLNTVGEENDFRPIMACHCSPEDSPWACKGYLAREGWNNLNVRRGVIAGIIDIPEEVLKACEQEGIELETDYQTVLKKLTKSQ